MESTDEYKMQDLKTTNEVLTEDFQYLEKQYKELSKKLIKKEDDHKEWIKLDIYYKQYIKKLQFEYVRCSFIFLSNFLIFLQKNSSVFFLVFFPINSHNM